MKNIKPVYGSDAREQLFQGITLLNDAVKVTLGPRGRNVLFRKIYEGIHPTKDGVTVAKEISFENEIHNMGAELVKQASHETGKNAGDGTTTSTVIAWMMMNEGLKVLHPGVNAIAIKRGMEIAVEEVVEKLSAKSIPLDGNMERIRNVATISSNNDTELGNIITDALSKIGIDGVIKVEESHSNETSMDIIQGMQFDRSYGSPYFVTDTDTMQVIYDSGCMVVVCADKITDPRDLDWLITYSRENKHPLIIIADDYTNEVLANLVMQKLRGSSKVFIVKAPFFGIKRRDYLDDICILTGATLMSKSLSRPISTIRHEDIGSVEKCISTKETTLMMNGSGDEEAISEWIKYLEGLSFDNPMEEEMNRERISRFKGGIGVLYVGGSSEAEIKEKCDRVDDALSATKAAVEEGIVPGGGVALFKISQEMSSEHSIECQIGYDIVKKAITYPFELILLNSGLTNEEIKSIKEEISKDDFNVGFDAFSHTICDMIESGIIDPTKVTRIALQNAVSVAGILLTTECVLVNSTIQEQESNLPAFLQN